ncbi:MAG TPA: type I-F CRISPR-associated helicase Cas3 [Aeromonadales bacterium]|nr:type I-F CRISPR-associated helicase Cas3 [Aeromonadales bacterium]
MMVTFVSQCEKKALNKTRRVLDAFANRIGNRTWQTVITEQGLKATKKLLRKTATKNTAVSCHWIRSRSRSELLWVVGSKDKFNDEGIVPVNYTESEIEQFMDNNRWKTIKIIKYAATIAGLFHDFGKANELFQEKLDPKIKNSKHYEPYRHEWVSLRLFQTFVESTCQTEKLDSQWLEALSTIKLEDYSDCFKDQTDNMEDNHPLQHLPPFARLVGWLILTHHKLPLYPGWKGTMNNPPPMQYMDEWFSTKGFSAVWNSHNCQDEDLKPLITKNWSFKPLPYKSQSWRLMTRSLASKTLLEIQSWLKYQQTDWLNDELFTTHLSRLCLILADHYYSSLTREEAKEQDSEKWRDENYLVHANTHTVNFKKQFKQQLDEHLIGVGHHALKIAEALPKLNSTLKPLENDYLGKSVKETLEKELDDKEKIRQLEKIYKWQDRAKKLASEIGKQTIEHGFFGINMASTGKGKTRANAKIMYALGEQTGRKRFSVALGLRTLTLQTGREYRREFNMDDKELAIMVGGDAVKQLFENEQNKHQPENEAEATGSQSQEDQLDKDLYLDYEINDFDHSLIEWTKNNDRLNKLIHAPVLVCTIDHLIPATEGTKGGKHIPAMLRLLTSDLVLDEPDDFDLNDLPALCRLVHWAGLSGSRVLLSTATLPPALANALFRAYKKGWSDYAKANLDGWNGEVMCAWFDEDDNNNFQPKAIKDNCEFKKTHEQFVKKRIKFLKEKNKPFRQGALIPKIELNGEPVIDALAQSIHQSIFDLHQNHLQQQAGKTLSIGLVRFANIDPLIAIARKLLKLGSNHADICIHYCVYHSRYPLAIRSYLENQLDRILKRNEPEAIWQHEGIIEKFQENPQKNHIFVVLASPVAEVGRDHDYDWAIVEPSSMRSIIQLAGRVLRHRYDDDYLPKTPNILLLPENYKALKGKSICFEKPGFETGEKHKTQKYKLLIDQHDLNLALTEDQYKIINAINRIRLPDDWDLSEKKDSSGFYTFNKLNGLEHKALAHRLLAADEAALLWWEKPKSWTKEKQWHPPSWCGEMQRQQRFRQSKKDEAYYRFLDSNHSEPYWKWKNEHVSPPKFGEVSGININENVSINFGQNCNFWFDLSTQNIYQKLANEMSLSLNGISHRFGEVRIVEYNKDKIENYSYHENLGLFKEIGE